jgi:hypothetical protein
MSLLWSLQHALQFQMPVGGRAVLSLSSRGTSGERVGERGFLCSVAYGFLSNRRSGKPRQAQRL